MEILAKCNENIYFCNLNYVDDILIILVVVASEPREFGNDL